MASPTIQFRDSNDPFRAAFRPSDEDWIDTSFADSPKAGGSLRYPGVNNGRYESKHPILDARGETVGYMVGGVGSIGYTFTCVYASNCFWIAHQGFQSTMNGGGTSVSLVDETGRFIFAKGRKFAVVKSFGFGRDWLSAILAFKLLDGGEYLLYLTKCGICLFNTRRRDIVATVDFGDIGWLWEGFALSPKVKLLALGFSVRTEKNLLDGEYRYKNFIRIYNLETGKVVGEQLVPGDRQTRWKVDFSEDGRQLRAASESSQHVFELIVTS